MQFLGPLSNARHADTGIWSPAPDSQRSGTKQSAESPYTSGSRLEPLFKSSLLEFPLHKALYQSWWWALEYQPLYEEDIQALLSMDEQKHI